MGNEEWDPGLAGGDPEPLREIDVEEDESEAARKTRALVRRAEKLSRRRRAEEEEELAARSRWSAAAALRGKPLREIVGAAAQGSPTKSEEESDMSKAGKANKGKQFVWADRYRLKFLKDFICNRDKAEELHQMVIDGHCSHLIFEGPPGVGKRTMVSALLRGIFGPEKSAMTDEVKVIEMKDEVVPNIEVNVKISPHQIEANLSEMHENEKHVIAHLFKDSSPKSNKAKKSDHSECRVLFLSEADRLSTDAQHYMRWVMEKYNGGNRIIFCCSNASKLRPIRRLCKIVALKPPSESEIIQDMEFIAVQERIELPHTLAQRMAENSK